MVTVGSSPNTVSHSLHSCLILLLLRSRIDSFCIGRYYRWYFVHFLKLGPGLPSELLLESRMLWVCIFGNILPVKLKLQLLRGAARVKMFFITESRNRPWSVCRKLALSKYIHLIIKPMYQLTIYNKSTYFFIVLQRGVTSIQWLLYQSISYSLHLLPCTLWTLGRRWVEGGETRGSFGNQR